jgi:tetratricopeptide (TPR) repeat protein
VLALRDAAAGISEEANNSQAYSIQADVQGILEQIEASIQAQYQLGSPTQQRNYQRLYAMRQALTVDPEQLQVLYRLAELYNSTGRIDFALEMAERALAVVRKVSDSQLTDQVVQISRQLNQMQQQLGPNLETVDSRIEEAKKAENFDRVQLALALNQGGYPQRALQLLEEDRLAIAGNQMAELQLAFLLAEAGRMEEAGGLFATFEQMGNAVAIPLEVVLQSCWLDMALGDYRSAARRCAERVQVLKSASTQALLATGPFAMPSPQFLGDANIWPATQTLVSSRTLGETASEISLLQWTSAMANLEAGECAEAAATLKTLIDDFPESQLRPLVKVWLIAITGEEISDFPPDIEPGIRFNDDSDMVARPTSAAKGEGAAPARSLQKDSSPTSTQ